jgi:hypothetical protein
MTTRCPRCHGNLLWFNTDGDLACECGCILYAKYGYQPAKVAAGKMKRPELGGRPRKQ